MKITKDWIENPGSETEPAGGETVRIVVNGEKQELQARFAYLSEFDQCKAESSGNDLALKQGWGNDATLVRCCQRAFVLAAALRRADDTDVQLFLGEGKASAGQVAMARLPRREAARLWDAWWAWMLREFPEPRTSGGPSDEQQEDATEQARGESPPVRI